MKGGVPTESAHVDERSAELGFTQAALFLVSLPPLVFLFV